MDAPLLLVVAFSITIVSLSFLFSRPAIKFGPGHLKSIALVVVGFLGVFAGLVVSNPTNATAVFGLLGALIGFVVGRSSKSDDA
jgi:hypothetical protein